MKPVAIVGTILIILGAIVLLRGLSFNSREDVLKIGDLKVTTEKSHDIPTWAGVAAIVGGVVMVGAGMKRKG